MAVTIKQIAELAGVAPTTVSLVLKDSKKVGAETKSKVLKIIAEMDYYPNHSGKLLKQGRTDAIAVISSFFQNIFKMELVNGVEQAIYGTKYQLRQYTAAAELECSKSKEILYGKMADAVIALSVLAEPGFLEKMRVARKPLVLVEDVVKGYAGVCFDNQAAAYDAVKYLAGKGRRKIAISVGMKAFMGHSFVDERLKGYFAALRDLGIEYSEIIELADYGMDSGTAILKRVGEMPNRPDALFCASGDLTAACFMKAATASGMRVPDDVAVIGFDDSIIAQTTTLGLTTIRQPIAEMGKAAFKLAIEMLEGDEEAYSRIVTFKPEIVVRESA
jgi:LacI family transcriptional regulator